MPNMELCLSNPNITLMCICVFGMVAIISIGNSSRQSSCVSNESLGCKQDTCAQTRHSKSPICPSTAKGVWTKVRCRWRELQMVYTHWFKRKHIYSAKGWRWRRYVHVHHSAFYGGRRNCLVYTTFWCFWTKLHLKVDFLKHICM